jgi:transcription-repair coupling factor
MSRLPDSEPGASPPSEAPRSPAKAPRPPAKAPRPSEPRAFLCDPERALASGEFELLARTLERRRALAVGGLWGASQALCLAVLSRRLQGPWLALVSTEAEGVALASDLEQFGAPALRLASRGDGARGQDDLALRERLITAQILCGPPAERLRGDILDVFPFASEWPLRVELFDDAIESLRTFDPTEQKSVEKLTKVAVCLARDAGGVEDSSGISPALLLPAQTVIAEVEPLRIEDRAHGLSIQSASHQRELGLVRQAQVGRRKILLQSLPAKDVNFDTRSVQALSGGIRQAPEQLRQATADGTRALVLCRTEAEESRFKGVLAEAGGVDHVETRVGAVAKGFRFPALALIVVDHHELVGILGTRRAAPAKIAHRTRALQSFFDLKVGDYVVHAVHGLALYRGLVRMARGAGEEEHLHLSFADEVSLYVPATRIDLVQRYIGGGGTPPPLDKIGSHSFRKRREKVERALFDLASDLLEVQAKRELKQRPPWRADPQILKDMVGAFPYVDTPDQAQADGDIAEDIEGLRPMDRLLCGDVGFGKTEIAMRAAFRVAAAGGQVAVLVPTTVLAHQHFLSFRERMADFPVEIGVLSRTVTGEEERKVLRGVAAGEVDIVIGTHRLLSKDVKFKGLGLIIIDEEQRFGVTHKEHFKSLRAMVDVLALSATPIPRTLHMSLAGVRDISALSTPPPGRQDVETVIVDRNDREFVRDALLREKNRDGQVFFLHNRVETIAMRARELQELAPDCTFAIGHGQMPSKQLEVVMDTFSRGDVDVLVATTIVENGLDIPAAGTILIDEADHYGLSELHQLRGRVGRGAHKAHCFLLVDPLKPMKQIARERLKALEEMSQLGSGFAISMKDLELRGAGNILGPQQSGHIASVGYDLYCRLLKDTVERVREPARRMAQPAHGRGPPGAPQAGAGTGRGACVARVALAGCGREPEDPHPTPPMNPFAFSIFVLCLAAAAPSTPPGTVTQGNQEPQKPQEPASPDAAQGQPTPPAKPPASGKPPRSREDRLEDRLAPEPGGAANTAGKGSVPEAGADSAAPAPEATPAGPTGTPPPAPEDPKAGWQTFNSCALIVNEEPVTLMDLQRGVQRRAALQKRGGRDREVMFSEEIVDRARILLEMQGGKDLGFNPEQVDRFVRQKLKEDQETGRQHHPVRRRAEAGGAQLLRTQGGVLRPSSPPALGGVRHGPRGEPGRGASPRTATCGPALRSSSSARPRAGRIKAGRSRPPRSCCAPTVPEGPNGPASAWRTCVAGSRTARTWASCPNRWAVASREPRGLTDFLSLQGLSAANPAVGAFLDKARARRTLPQPGVHGRRQAGGVHPGAPRGVQGGQDPAFRRPGRPAQLDQGPGPAGGRPAGADGPRQAPGGGLRLATQPVPEAAGHPLSPSRAPPPAGPDHGPRPDAGTPPRAAPDRSSGGTRGQGTQLYSEPFRNRRVHAGSGRERHAPT